MGKFLFSTNVVHIYECVDPWSINVYTSISKRKKVPEMTSVVEVYSRALIANALAGVIASDCSIVSPIFPWPAIVILSCPGYLPLYRVASGLAVWFPESLCHFGQSLRKWLRDPHRKQVPSLAQHTSKCLLPYYSQTLFSAFITVPTLAFSDLTNLKLLCLGLSLLVNPKGTVNRLASRNFFNGKVWAGLDSPLLLKSQDLKSDYILLLQISSTF